MKTYLLIPRIRIQNANAMSSPYTIGFPAMTAWLGAVHALQRSVQQNGIPRHKKEPKLRHSEVQGQKAEGNHRPNNVQRQVRRRLPL